MRFVMILLVSFAVGIVLSCMVQRPKNVKASDDCPVVSATPDGNGGAVVVFNCQAYIVTIDEPQWP